MYITNNEKGSFKGKNIKNRNDTVQNVIHIYSQSPSQVKLLNKANIIN